ncbi:MAG TPA: DUF3499 domain-containing protein [Actinomycetaceae bacterium]|nr:DUF3499 domain-containing protein [Actinomycetaceae bacterium]
MKISRLCSRNACTRGAVATLTYDYSDSTAVLGPLSTAAEPHAYDLCEHHAEALTVPRGWQVIRLATHFEPAPPSEDDLYALAEAVREASRSRPAQRAADRAVSRGAESMNQSVPDPAVARRAAFRVVHGGQGDD